MTVRAWGWHKESVEDSEPNQNTVKEPAVQTRHSVHIRAFIRAMVLN